MEKCGIRRWKKNPIRLRTLLKLNHINVYILTGGSSRRFGSDKALGPIYNHTFTEELYNNFSIISNKVTIVGKRQYFDTLPFIYDLLDVQCPLVGLYTALIDSETSWNFIISVDMPLIDREITQLFLPSRREKVKIILPRVNDRLYPLCAFYHSSLKEKLYKTILQKSFRLMDVINDSPHQIVDLLDTSNQFVNINTLDQIKRLG